MAKKNIDEPADGNDAEPIEVKSAPKVNDIAKPGETPSTPTSRPIITKHSMIIKQDPMVSGKPEEEKIEDEEKDQVVKKSEIKIEPIVSTEPKEEKKEEAKSDEEKPEEAETEEQKPEEESPPETDADSAEAENEDTSDSAAIDSLATSAEARKTSKDAEEEEKRKQKIKELVDTKKYFVPVVEGGHKASSQRFATWLLLILLVGAIVVYLLIDAGYIDVGISLPVDLIKN